MSRTELAEAVCTWLWHAKRQTRAFESHYVARPERGAVRRPGADYRAVLGVPTDAHLGMAPDPCPPRGSIPRRGQGCLKSTVTEPAKALHELRVRGPKGLNLALQPSHFLHRPPHPIVLTRRAGTHLFATPPPPKSAPIRAIPLIRSPSRELSRAPLTHPPTSTQSFPNAAGSSFITTQRMTPPTPATAVSPGRNASDARSVMLIGSRFSSARRVVTRRGTRLTPQLGEGS